MAHKHKKTHTFNTLRFAKKLKSAGFTQQQAETQSEAFSEIIHDQLATKADLEKTETTFKMDLEKTETTLRSEMKLMETRLSNNMELLRRDMKLWFGAMMVSAVAFLSTLMTALSFIHH